MRLTIILLTLILITAACAQDSAPQPVIEVEEPQETQQPEVEEQPQPSPQVPDFEEGTEPDAAVPGDIAELSEDGSDLYDIFRSAERPTQGVDADLNSINERIQEKTDGFVYTYRVVDFDEAGALDNTRVYEQNDQRLIILPARVRAMEENARADHILFTPQETYAWCEGCVDFTRLVTVENPEQYIPPSPVSWLEAIQDMEKKSGMQVDGRAVDTFTTITEDGEEIVIGVDRFAGLPIYVEQGNYVHTYEQVAFKATDSAFALPEQE